MKKVLPILLSVIVIISIFATVVISSGATEESPVYYISGDYTYTVVGTTDAMIAGYSGTATEITIPETIDNYKVTAINELAFVTDTTVTSVTLPSTVVRVGEYAFFESVVSTVTFMNAQCEIFDSEYTIPQSAVIRGYDNSTAQEYATKYERVFESLGEVTVIPTEVIPSVAPPTEIPNPTQQLPSETVAPTEIPTETVAPTVPQLLVGDVDGDGEISIMDATAVQLHIAAIEIVEDDRLYVADADRDGEVTIMDATQIQLFIAQIIDSL